MRHMLPHSRPRPLASCAALLTSLLCACAHPPGGQPSATREGSGAAGKTVLARILAINDFHGNLAPPEGSAGEVRTGRLLEGKPERVKAGGAAWLAAHLSRLRAESPAAPPVMVSAGDLIGASPLLSALFHDEPTIEAMNLMGLALHGVGNHEFDEGTAELLRMRNGGCHPVEGCQGREPFAGARFEFLAANVVDAKGATLFPAYALREFEGVKVAFIGMTLQGTPEIVDASSIQGLRFLDEADTVNALVPELRKQGVRAIVVLVHEGERRAAPTPPTTGARGSPAPSWTSSTGWIPRWTPSSAPIPTRPTTASSTASASPARRPTDGSSPTWSSCWTRRAATWWTAARTTSSSPTRERKTPR
ncbi:hypothetical protein ACN28S_49380 [Cystobacter fuscus]